MRIRTRASPNSGRLLSRPEQLDAVRRDNGLVPQASEEGCAGRCRCSRSLELLVKRLPVLRPAPDRSCDGVTGLGPQAAVRLAVLFDTVRRLC